MSPALRLTPRPRPKKQHEADDAVQHRRAAAREADDAERERQDENRAWRARRGQTTIDC